MSQNSTDLLKAWRRQTGITPIPLSQQESHLPIRALAAAFSSPKPTPQADPATTRPPTAVGSKAIMPVLARQLAAYRKNAKS